MVENMINNLKNGKKKAVAIALAACTMLSSFAAFAETSSSTNETALQSISDAMLTSVNGTVAMMITLVVGLVPVALQVLTAFLLFKFGKKFFNQIG